jgi:hypothetical protein
MSTFRLIALLFVASTALFAQHRQVKPEKLRPDNAEHFAAVSLHNTDVIVRKLDIPAGASEPIGAGVHDYLLISLGSNSLRVTGYQTDFELNFADGDIQVLQGAWPHKIHNQSTTTAQLVMVEVERNLFPRSATCGLASKNCGEVRFGKSAEGEYQQTTLFETDTAKLFRVRLGAGVAVHQHDDGRPHLLIALTAFQGRADDGTFTLQPRETYWHPGSMQELVNDGSADTRFLILELKKKY